jgi:hypothetical protein
MKIEILYIADCPSHAGAVKLVKDALAAEGLPAEIDEVLVKNERMAKQLEFSGSPTIRINGRDVAGEQRASHFGLGCRLYPAPGSTPGLVGLPPAEMVRRAVAETWKGEKK